MSRRLLVCTLCTLWITSCKNERQHERKAEKKDSLAAVQSIVREDTAAIIKNKLDVWLATALQKQGIEWHKLRLEEYAKEEFKPFEPFTPPENFYKDYAEVLRWSPDSGYVLDVGSYGSVLVKDKNGNVHVEAGEPDTEISLVDVKKRQKRNLFFVGPSSVIIDGTWVDTSNALILGSFDEQGNQQPDTLFWLINVKENFYRMYKWKR